MLSYLAAQVGPVGAVAIARDLGIPRSSAYHLLAEMSTLGYVVHFPEEERWGLGVAAFEVGSAYLRHDPLERMATPVLTSLVRDVGERVALVAHLGILHGRETMYLLKFATGKPLTLVTEVGVRLPASLTATGRAILAQTDRAQVRALFENDAAFVLRTGAGPASPAQLRELLAVERERGYAEEDGLITEGFASVAVAVHDHAHRPIAAIGVTFRSADVDKAERTQLAGIVSRRANRLSHRLGEK